MDRSDCPSRPSDGIQPERALYHGRRPLAPRGMLPKWIEAGLESDQVCQPASFPPAEPTPAAAPPPLHLLGIARAASFESAHRRSWSCASGGRARLLAPSGSIE